MSEFSTLIVEYFCRRFVSVIWPKVITGSVKKVRDDSFEDAVARKWSYNKGTIR